MSRILAFHVIRFAFFFRWEEIIKEFFENLQSIACCRRESRLQRVLRLLPWWYLSSICLFKICSVHCVNGAIRAAGSMITDSQPPLRPMVVSFGIFSSSFFTSSLTLSNCFPYLAGALQSSTPYGGSIRTLSRTMIDLLCQRTGRLINHY